MTKAEEPQTLPDKIGPYRIQRQIGSGGMGNVYLAVHEDLRRVVALKVLRPSMARDDGLLKRFRNEARAAAMPVHENLVIFYEHGQDGEYHYLALEYIKGKDLARIIDKKGPLPASFCLEIIKQAARALEHANKHGFVHRDIKPSNFLITPDHKLKLTDMGLARQLESLEDDRVTRDGYTLGTVDYMSPEQARNSHAADIRSDMYSLGCTWYHMLTGNVPYPGGTSVERLYSHAHAPLPDIRRAIKDFPDEMAMVLERMMEKDPKDRYQTPAELLADLEQLDPHRAASDGSLLSMLAQIEQGDDSEPAVKTRKSRNGERGSSSSSERRAVDDDAPVVSEFTRLELQRHRHRSEPADDGNFWKLLAVGAVVGLILLGIFLAVEFFQPPSGPSVVP